MNSWCLSLSIFMRTNKRRPIRHEPTLLLCQIIHFDQIERNNRETTQIKDIYIWREPGHDQDLTMVSRSNDISLVDKNLVILSANPYFYDTFSSCCCYCCYLLFMIVLNPTFALWTTLPRICHSEQSNYLPVRSISKIFCTEK